MLMLFNLQHTLEEIPVKLSSVKRLITAFEGDQLVKPRLIGLPRYIRQIPKDVGDPVIALHPNILTPTPSSAGEPRSNLRYLKQSRRSNRKVSRSSPPKESRLDNAIQRGRTATAIGSRRGSTKNSKITDAPSQLKNLSKQLFEILENQPVLLTRQRPGKTSGTGFLGESLPRMDSYLHLRK